MRGVKQHSTKHLAERISEEPTREPEAGTGPEVPDFCWASHFLKTKRDFRKQIGDPSRCAEVSRYRENHFDAVEKRGQSRCDLPRRRAT